MVKIGVVADDFTGTASSGMMMAKAQVETGLFFDAASLDAFEYTDRLEAVYVSSNSRFLPPEDAKKIVRESAEALKKAGAQYYSKKIETTALSRRRFNGCCSYCNATVKTYLYWRIFHH